MPTRTLALFGISGRTGHALARAAVDRGWAVRGFARHGSSVPAALGTFVVRGDFMDAPRVAEVVEDTEAVCCVLGPRPPYTEAFCAQATNAIIQAMGDVGVRRIVCQTGALIGAGNRTFLFERLARSIARRQPAAAEDRVEQERLVQQSGLDWTLVKPPRLTDGVTRHAVKADTSLRVGLLSTINRVDVAAFILDAIERAQYVCARVFVRG